MAQDRNNPRYQTVIRWSYTSSLTIIINLTDNGVRNRTTVEDIPIITV